MNNIINILRCVVVYGLCTIQKGLLQSSVLPMIAVNPRRTLNSLFSYGTQLLSVLCLTLFSNRYYEIRIFQFSQCCLTIDNKYHQNDRLL